MRHGRPTINCWKMRRRRVLSRLWASTSSIAVVWSMVPDLKTSDWCLPALKRSMDYWRFKEAVMCTPMSGTPICRLSSISRPAGKSYSRVHLARSTDYVNSFERITTTWWRLTWFATGSLHCHTSMSICVTVVWTWIMITWCSGARKACRSLSSVTTRCCTVNINSMTCFIQPILRGSSAGRIVIPARMHH